MIFFMGKSLRMNFVLIITYCILLNINTASCDTT